LCHRFLSDPTFFLLLLVIDQDIAEKVRAAGCPCGGRLHQANFARKPRGGPPQPEARLSLRLSFCCDVEGCRCRSTPPSVRFLGRRVYLGVLVVLITALRQGPTPHGYEILRERFGADRRTIARWQRWWKESFAVSKFWKAARGRLASLSQPTEYPASLVLLFDCESAERMANLLRFLCPLGASSRFELQAF